MDEEFELLPSTPLRRLERRLERLEQEINKKSGETFLKEIVDIIKVNQLIIDEVVKSNEALKLEISKLYPKLDSLVVQMNELLNFIKSSVFQETIGTEAFRPLIKKMSEISEGIKTLVEVNKQTTEQLKSLENKIDKKLTLLTSSEEKPKPSMPLELQQIKIPIKKESLIPLEK
ncbi:MAG: hypothetical protein QW678_02310 [Candidatus Aenigmatarchaeota archaeon]